MTRFLTTCWITLAVSSLSARADAPRPPAGKQATASLAIEINDKVQEPRLQVPRQFLTANPIGPRGDAAPVLPTIMTGLALALALSFGGLWLVRRGRGVQGPALLVAAIACAAVGAATAWADRALPRPPVPAVAARFDKVAVEITDKGDQVKLIVNRAHLAKLTEQARPGVKR